jgi:hypothetical protein
MTTIGNGIYLFGFLARTVLYSVMYRYNSLLAAARCDFGFGLGLFSPVSHSGVWLSIEY